MDKDMCIKQIAPIGMKEFLDNWLPQYGAFVSEKSKLFGDVSGKLLEIGWQKSLHYHGEAMHRAMGHRYIREAN